ncbi:hypothetical protein LTR84_007478 [Exophiala bonariae]|uniref:Nucleoside phosphorylase domain-containing protein n=1 Tax=Exophiala bonariae TaxID=1690606 RepID=A0AAV9MYZ8_9EURO|nr:hypothetical protein LTR84_007478 [Exophiala bonariae]
MGVELCPVEAMLDEIHPPISRNLYSDVKQYGRGAYTLGRIGGHNIVVAAMPQIGNNAAAIVANQLWQDFPFVELRFLVGIGGGIPGGAEDEDIRLGDVVRTGMSARPPAILSANVERLKSLHHRERSRIPQFLEQMFERFPKMNEGYLRPNIGDDRLFKSNCLHQGGPTCQGCPTSQLIVRRQRTSSDPRIHYGIIGSGNTVVKDSYTRDCLKQDLNIICVDMEASGLVDAFPSLVVRGICDYADSHKNKNWQAYAAAVAAAYMKELLLIVPHEILVKREGKQNAKHDMEP